MTTSLSSPCTVNGATLTWTSSAFVTGASNSSNNGFKSGANVTLALPTGSTLKSISKSNGNAWGSGAKVVVYAGNSSSGSEIASIVTGTDNYTISSNNTGGTFYLINSTTKNAWMKTLVITYETSNSGGGDSNEASVTFNPVAGTYETSQTITLSTNVSTDHYPYIYYTVDGTEPTDDNYEGYFWNGSNYNILDEEEDFIISSTCTVKARVYDTYDWENPSDVFTATYTIQQATRYTVTIETPEHGTLVIKNGETIVNSGDEFPAGTVFTAYPTPDEGYKFRNWQAVDGSTHTYTASYTYTLSEHDVTFKAHFDEIPQYVYTWSVNGTIIRNETLNEGDAVSFPSVQVQAYSNKVFVGWVTTETVSAETTPAFVGTSDVTATANTDYYAVFADESEGGAPTYEKLSSQNFDTNATYVLAATQSSSDNTMWYLVSYGNTDVNVDWGEMTNNPSTNTPLTFKLSGSANALVAKDSNGNYLDHGAKKFKMSSTETTSILNTNGSLSYSSGSKMYYLRHNYNSGNGGLRWYDSNTGTYAYFYKVVSGTTCSNYTTSLPAPTVTVSAAGYATYVAVDNVSFPSDVSAFIVDRVSSASIHLEPVSAVRKDVPVVVKAAAGTYNLNLVEESACQNVTGNLLMVSDGNVTNGVLVLANKSNGVGFYKWAGGTLPAGKVYLENPNLSREFFGFTDDEATGIEALETPTDNLDDAVYNIQGQKVNGLYKGIVIMNGKKVIK